MTKRRVTVSVPPDVAEHLESQGQGKASAYVTAAVRDRRRWDEFCVGLTDAGVPLPTERGMAEARARRLAVRADWPEERYAALEDRVRQHLGGETADRPASAA